jgi:hypothetical protein
VDPGVDYESVAETTGLAKPPHTVAPCIHRLSQSLRKERHEKKKNFILKTLVWQPALARAAFTQVCEMKIPHQLEINPRKR